MEIYIVTKTTCRVYDGYYEGETKKAVFRRKEEWYETKETAFVSYIKAAKYIHELLVEENKHYDAFEEKDIETWSAFFIGFHHMCQLQYKGDPLLEAYFKGKNVPPPCTSVRYEIKTLDVDYEVLDETEEILRGLA